MKKPISFLCAIAMLVQVLIPFSAVTALAAEDTQSAYQEPASPAVTYNMNIDWKYKKAEGTVYPLAKAAESVVKDGKNFYEVDYDDSDWETVSVPHPINAKDSFDENCYDSGEGIWRGFSFYRKHITVPQTDAGKKLFLEFEAVRQSVYLYVNGEMVGYYEAGISAMGFDVTDYIKVGEDNLIAVATDNSSDRGQADASLVTHETKPGSEPGAADGIGYQWNTKDFNEVQGGITGNVNLYAKGKVYQTLPLYNNLKTTGNYIYATDFDVRENKATITVEGEIRNESGEDKDITLEVNVVDNDGNVVSTFEKSAAVAAAEDAGEVIKSTVPADAYDENPAPTSVETVDVTKITASAIAEGIKFWSPDSPNLYDVYTILKASDGTVLDVQKTTTGFRKVDYDITDGGLKINDTPVWLTGYAQRSTNEWAVIGVANDWLQDMDMQWVKESNSNFIRWMHVAPKPSQIRSGDKYGVVSVCPAGDKEADIDGRAWDQRVEAMRDAMIYFRNSPSVLFWESGNNAISVEHLQEMAELEAKLDPNGGRFSGCRTISSVDQVKAADYVGTMLNRHAAGAKASMATANKYVPIMETEYAREEAPRRVWDDFSPPDYDYRNKWLGAGASKKDGYDVHDLTSEDFAVVDVNAYNEFYSDRVGGSSGNDYYSAAAIMVWSDSNMHTRNTGTENCRTSGKVDAVRIKKEAFYALQAAQSTTPKIHIIGHWNYPQVSDDTYNYPLKQYNGTYWEETGEYGKRDPKNKTVYVIGSAGIAKMELYVNDVLKGTSTKPTNTFVFSFPYIDVTESGTVKAVAYDARNQVIAEDSISTVGEAVTIKLTPMTGPDGLIADGSDIAYFDLAVVDKDGNTCPLAYDKINLSVAGEGVLLGGYNSGVGDKITTNKDYCYAECGTNRIFVRSTRKAGDITLSASMEGQAPVTATIKSVDDLEMQDGLTTKMQRAIPQGAVIEPPKEVVPAMKSLSSVFTADFSENGNTEVVSNEEMKDEYTMTINGKAVEGYTKTPYRPDTTTGVLCDTIKTLDALKASGLDIEYTIYNDTLPEFAASYDGTAPLVSITKGLAAGYKQLDVMNGSTTLFFEQTDGIKDKNLLNAQIEYQDGELITDIASVLGYIDGVVYQLDTDAKTANITIKKSAPSEDAVITNTANGVEVNALTALTGAKIVFASYENNALKSIDIQNVTLAEGEKQVYTPSATFIFTSNTKAMLWKSDMITPVCAPVAINPMAEAASLMADEVFAGDVLAYDTLVSKHDGEATSISGITVEDGAPDGTKYLKTGTSEACMQSEVGYGSNTKEDIMLSCDIMFNEAQVSGFTPKDQGDKKIAGTLSIRGTTFHVQYGGSSYRNTNIPAAVGEWYHVALVGRFSASDAAVTMYVWKYNDSGVKEFVGKSNYDLRNLAAGNNNGVSHLNISANTCVDNIEIYKLGADKLNVSSGEEEIKAGETMLFTYGATRAGDYITAPAVTWSVYNEANDAALNDSEITVNEGGLLTIGANATTQKINVRATANAGTDKEVFASKTIQVNAVDTSSDSYDEITVTASKDTIRAGEQVTITAETKKNGAVVTPADGDINYVVCNEANLRELGNKYITVTKDGVLTVTAEAVPQKVAVKGVNKSGSISDVCIVEILPANMNCGNEDTYTDTFVSSNACEEYVTGLTLMEGSWDGSGYYSVSAGTDFVGFPSNTSADVVYSADMKFANDGAGWTIYDSGKGKLGLQLTTSGSTLQAIGASNKVVGSLAIDNNAWYNVSVMAKTGSSPNSYAVMTVYKYDENGKKVNPQTGAENTPYILTCALRNLSESTANHININGGTMVDNILNMYVAPDKLTLTVDAETVLAGGSANASATASRKGIDFPYISTGLIKYEIYDAQNQYPLGDDKIQIDASGKITVDAMAEPQDVYVRVMSTSGGMSDSKKLTIKSSDIFEITKAGFDENYTELRRIEVTENFYYKSEVTFVAAVYDENGVMKTSAIKKMYGDQMNIGSNKIAFNMTLPTDFDKTKDTLRIFAVTKLSTDEVTEKDGTLAATIGSDNAVTVTKAPEYDNGMDIVVLIIKADANEKNVKAEDILYVNSVKNLDGIKAAVPSGSIIKTAGKVGGVLTIAAASL